MIMTSFAYFRMPCERLSSAGAPPCLFAREASAADGRATKCTREVTALSARRSVALKRGQSTMQNHGKADHGLR